MSCDALLRLELSFAVKSHGGFVCVLKSYAIDETIYPTKKKARPHEKASVLPDFISVQPSQPRDSFEGPSSDLLSSSQVSSVYIAEGLNSSSQALLNSSQTSAIRSPTPVKRLTESYQELSRSPSRKSDVILCGEDDDTKDNEDDSEDRRPQNSTNKETDSSEGRDRSSAISERSSKRPWSTTTEDESPQSGTAVEVTIQDSDDKATESPLKRATSSASAKSFKLDPESISRQSSRAGAEASRSPFNIIRSLSSSPEITVRGDNPHKHTQRVSVLTNDTISTFARKLSPVLEVLNKIQSAYHRIVYVLLLTVALLGTQRCHCPLTQRTHLLPNM